MKKIIPYTVPLILLFAFLFRVYRTTDLMGFYFDQGRDAKIIWDLWHQGKPFLIGPTTGIEGIFLGPFYYYLIAPAYLIGNGNPSFPAIWLVMLNVAGMYLIYKIGKEFFTAKAGLIAIFILALSNRLIQDHRWLSNPTPLPLFSSLSVYILLKIINSQAKTIHFALLGLSLGLSLQLEAASATFFLPATLIIFLLNLRSIVGQFKNILHTALTFSLTLIPQLWFNFRHDNILFEAFYRFLISEKSFQTVLPSFYLNRLAFYYQVFFEKLINNNQYLPLFVLLVVIAFLISFPKILNRNFGLLVVWVVTPLIFLLFYHGNYGYVWGYYFTGIYSVFILLIAIVLSSTPRYVYFLVLVLFTLDNTIALKNFLTAGLEGPYSITLGNSLSAVDWVYQDTKSIPFNVDVYVPPVISHSYDYLFLWRGKTKYSNLPETNMVPRLYTLYEQDPPHPERLQAWLKRQSGYAQIDTEFSFGGVSAQRRIRYP